MTISRRERVGVLIGAAGLTALLMVSGVPLLSALTLGCLGAVLIADLRSNGIRSDQGPLALAIAAVAGFALARLL